MGSTVETVVSTWAWGVPTRSPSLGFGGARDAVDGGFDLGEAQVEFGLADFRAGPQHLGFRGLNAPDGLVLVLLAHRPGLGQGQNAVQRGLGGPENGLMPGQNGLGHVQRRLERSRVDLEEKRPLLDETAFSVVLPDQVALHLGENRGVHQPVHAGHVVLENGNVFLNHVGHGHLRRWRLRRIRLRFGFLLLGVAHPAEDGHQRHENQHHDMLCLHAPSSALRLTVP
jgi:hypothetical protein